MKKTCGWCKKPKPLSAYSPHKTAADGLAYHCRGCRAGYERQRREASGKTPKRPRNPAHLAAGKKECFVCNKLLKLSAFSPAARGWGGVAYSCKKCFAASNRLRRADGSHATYIRAWRAKNPNWLVQHRTHQYRRRDKQRVRLPWGSAAALLRTSRCHYCRKSTPQDQRTIDHVVTLSRGGENTPSNIVMACGTCNSRKSNLTEAEFRRRLSCRTT